MKFQFFILFFFYSFFVISQEATQDDYKKIMEAYQKYPDMILKIKYCYFPTYTSDSPVEEKTGILKKHGDLQLSDFSDLITLNSKDYLVVINKIEKKMIVRNPLKITNATLDNFDIKAIIKGTSYVEKNKIGNLIELVFNYKKNVMSEYNIVKIYVSEATYLVEKIVFYYRSSIAQNTSGKTKPDNKPRLEITFSNINLSPHFLSDEFSEKKYIIKTNKKIQCNNNYKGFQLINQKL